MSTSVAGRSRLASARSLASTRERALHAPLLHGTPAGRRRPGFVVLGVLVLALGFGALGAAPAHASGKKGDVGLGIFLGGGTYKNDDFNRDLNAHGYGSIDSGVEYGFGVDYRFSRWFSVGFEVLRVGGDAAQPTTGVLDSLGQYSATASPLAFDLTAHVARSPRGNLDL